MSIRNQADIIMVTNQKREQEREKKEKEGKKNEKSINSFRYLGLKHYIFFYNISFKILICLTFVSLCLKFVLCLNPSYWTKI